ncbi:MAG: DUF2062 domain-containing protein [Chthoniobacter sp.]|uniref:DUF2062 domain-containing protein n=1 Tax=Chthoniobacter sp. TaxID=2510640 RepID=UPI0032ADB15B
MHSFKRRYYHWLRHIPRRRHLKGGRLHRLLGERLFAEALWKPTRQTVAGGLALGLFVGFSPTMGIQLILSGVAAVFLRVNIPMALAGSFVTNPFSAAIIYPLEYQLGIWLVGTPQPRDLEGYASALRNFARYARPLWAGSLVFSSLAAALAYGGITLLWNEARTPKTAPQLPDETPPPPGTANRP